MLNYPFKESCHEEEIFKQMLQKATIFSEQQFPLLYWVSEMLRDGCAGRKLQLLTAAGQLTFVGFLFLEFFSFVLTINLGILWIFKIFRFCSATNLTNSYLKKKQTNKKTLCMPCQARVCPIVQFKRSNDSDFWYHGCNSLNCKGRPCSDFTHGSVWKHLISETHAQVRWWRVT